MGVFARFSRKSKAAAEESTADTTVATLTAEPEAEGEAEAAEEAGATEVAVAEGIEIPKQQSAAAAADNEAGEGART
ncbi:hypothetical protein [Streptomyces beijiangensis]|uniref:Gliding motility protein n=1 Tax=Streptomyces beijiangensis TaxID=163361 RepID=A0A939F4Z9_9ACTN|nr:hypothetical protein [Streptomyces beijiangensis]MBO0511839.1 hypothetical protein [Streptomyces beijiangensis]